MASEAHLTVKQAAEQLQVGDATVRRWLREGKMRGTWISDRAGWRIPASEVQRVLTEGFGSTEGEA